MSTIARGAILNLAFRVASVVLALAITVITARLGTEERGSYSLLTLSASIITTLFSGLGPAIAYRISRQQQHASPLVADGLVFGTTVGLITGAMLLTVSQLFPFAPYNQLVWLAIAAPFLLWTTVSNGVYLGMGRMLPFNLNTISASAIIILLCAIGAWLAPLDLDRILRAWAISQVGAAILAMFFLWRLVGIARPAMGRLRSDARFITHIGLANVISTLNYRADLFLVQFFLGLAATGIYSIAIAVAELLWFVSSSLTIAAYQRIGAVSESDASSLTLRVVRLNFVLLLIAAPILAGLAWFGLPWLVGEEYRASLGVLLVLLPGVVLFGSASSLSAYYTNQLGRPELSTRVASISLTINVIVALVLIPIFGIYGAALASSIAYGVGIVISFLLFSRYSQIPIRKIVGEGLSGIRADIRLIAGSLRR